MENFAKRFLDIVTIHNDEISYVMHVLAPLCVFFNLFGCWGGGGGPKGAGAQPANAVFQGHNVLMQFSSFPASAAQKWKFMKLFFWIL